ncbi:MAG: hypothetical protein RI945_361 [Candidatus Parcubacteria bacterium]|jgi:hypothetical protein
MKKVISLTLLTILTPIYSYAEITENFKKFGDNITNNLFTSFGTLLMTAAFVLFIYGLVVFVLGRISEKGDLKDLEKGKSFMLWGLIALFVMVSSWGIIRLAQDLLDIKGNNIDLKPVSFNMTKEVEKKEGLQRFGVSAGQAIKQETFSGENEVLGEKVETNNTEENYVEEIYMENDAPPDFVESCGESETNTNIFTSLLLGGVRKSFAQQYCTMKDLTEANKKILRSFVNTSIPCPPGTKDLGIVQTEYIPLNKPKIRLCQISSIKGVGRDTKDAQVQNPVFNSVVAAKFQDLGEKLAKENKGKAFVAISSFRTHGTSFYSPAECKKNPDNCSGDGYSLHQLGVAIDFERSKMPVSTRGDITCKNRAVSTSLEYKLINKLAPPIGIKQLANESWHWDAFPDPNTRCQ